MVVLPGRKRVCPGEKFSGHPEVDAQPAILADAKKHLFSMSVGGDQGFSFDSADQTVSRYAAEDPFAGMNMDLVDFLVQAWIPLFAKEFHLGQLGHDRKLNQFSSGTSPCWKKLLANTLAMESGLGRRTFSANFQIGRAHV